MDMHVSGPPVNIQSTSSSQQAPPHNIELEQGLLGAILLFNEVWHRLPEMLPDHFYDPLHGEVFHAIGEVIGDGRAVDPVVLGPRFVNHPPITDDLTVPQYLGRLATMAPTITNAPSYAQAIVELATRRRLIEVAWDIAEGAVAPDAKPSDLVASAEELLLSVSDARGRQTQISFADAIDKVVTDANEAFVMGGRPRGATTGFIDLDKRLGGLVPGNLLIIAGRPSMGKTALAVNVGWHLADLHRRTGGEQGCVVQFDSMEMTADELARRVLATVSGVTADKIGTGMMANEEVEAVVRAGREIRDTPFYIDEGGGMTIAKIAARARRVKRQRGFGLLIVDYLQLIGGEAGGNGNRVQDVTAITVGLKALAKELACPIIALSQLSRQVEQRTDKRPQLSDLRESGSIEQDADVVMFVFREEYYIERERPNEDDFNAFADWQRRLQAAEGKAEVIIGKARHGRVGIVPLAWDGALTRFSNLSMGHT